MATCIIQFARLEELVAEELPAPVRVVALDVTETASSQIPGLRVAGIGVHVRAVNAQGQILACYLPVASVQVYDSVPRGSDPTRREYDAAWEQAEALKERVLAYLSGQGVEVRGAGVIHLAGVPLLPGSWRSDPAGVRSRVNGSGSN